MGREQSRSLLSLSQSSQKGGSHSSNQGSIIQQVQPVKGRLSNVAEERLSQHTGVTHTPSIKADTK